MLKRKYGRAVAAKIVSSHSPLDECIQSMKFLEHLSLKFNGRSIIPESIFPYFSPEFSFLSNLLPETHYLLDGYMAKDMKAAKQVFTLTNGLTVVAGSHTGYGVKLTRNQDRVLLDVHRPLFAVLDGMSGKSYGEETAVLFGQQLLKYYPDVEKAARETQEKLKELKITNAGVCFLAAEIVDQGQGRCVRIVQAGDCRLLLFNETGDLIFQTRPDRWIEDEIENGTISRFQARKSPGRHRVTAYVGLGSNPRTRFDVVEHKVQPGYRIVMMSDGIEVDPQVIEFFIKGKPADKAYDEIVDMLLESYDIPVKDSEVRIKRDNLSLMIVDV